MGSGRIIVVDDDKNLIELVKMRLESAGYDVTAAVQEDEALSAVKTHSFDICLLDLMLRDRDGIALMGEMHAVAPDIPVIILTAHGSIESALFGHEKGSFTGAVRSTRGLFTQSHAGTLFLDEIGDMPLSTQSKLLRALQERQFYPVGSDVPVEVDVRVIVATNKDLEEQVKKGLFREDLFYRIHVIPICVPPLRERKEDIVPLVESFLKKFSEQMKKEVKGLTPEALRKLMLHDWPGNVRELENTIEYAIAMTQDELVTEDYVLQTKAFASENGRGLSHDYEVANQGLKTLKDARDAFERDYLVQVLAMTEGNVSQAAKLAGKYRADFYDLLKSTTLKSKSFREPNQR